MTQIRRIVCCLTLCSLIATVHVSAGELIWPDSRAAEIAREYIDSFNSNDFETLRDFAAKYRSEKALAERSADARAERRLQMFQQIGLLIPVVITKEKSDSLTLKCRAGSDGLWLRVKVKLQDEAPHKLAYVEMAPTSAPAPKEDELLDDRNQTVSLAAVLETVRKESGAPGLAAVVIEGGEVVDLAVAGLRSMDSADPIKPTDRWHIGSISKSITATMIGSLVEQDVLRWETTIGDVLGELPMNEAYRGVTVAQLLRHRGGFAPYTVVDEEEEQRLAGHPGSPGEQRERFVKQLLLEKPAGDIGEFLYSNAGYTVVAHMAERLAAKEWASLLKDHVFGPVGMTRAGTGWPAALGRSNEPRGHRSDGGEYRPQPLTEAELGAYLAPARDLHMSIGDLASYAIAHLNGLAGSDGFLRAETIRYLHQPRDDTESYACGWMLSESGHGRVHGHAGSAGTCFAQLEIFPESMRGIVVVTNIGLEGAGLGQRVSELVRQRWSSPAETGRSHR
ncbi:MAG: beta-lactamase family protein [Thermoanaerobaculia bacterium]|nr:beta-lactamase family protein [Thermoanaerobaculia bacterium]